jgi:hypothetical protein
LHLHPPTQLVLVLFFFALGAMWRERVLNALVVFTEGGLVREV